MNDINDGMDLIATVVALANGNAVNKQLWFKDATAKTLVPWTNNEDTDAQLLSYEKEELELSPYNIACARVQFSFAVKKLLYPTKLGCSLQRLQIMDTKIPNEVWKHLV